MCMMINRNEFPKIVEQEDIEVFKAFYIFAGKLCSPYQTFEYEPDTLYHAEIGEEHNYNEQCPFDEKERDDYSNDPSYSIKYISTGFHSAVTSERLGELYNKVIVKCIVPKGSLYLTNRSGLMVSNQIFISKEEINKSLEKCAWLSKNQQNLKLQKEIW
jgi:hypothetical protein